MLADLTVTLDTPRTLGNLTFGDVDPATAGSWILGNGGNVANILTLDGGTPTITVNPLGAGKLAQIDAQITATSLGFTKAGTGALRLTNAANTGNIVVSAGTLTAGGGTDFTNRGLGTGQITIQGGATVNSTLGSTSGGTWTVANAFVIPTGQTGNLITPNRMRMNGAVSGGGTLNWAVNSTASRMDLQNNWTGFTGNLNITGSGTVRLGIVALVGGQPTFNAGSWASTSMDLGGSVALVPTTNSGGNTIPIASLAGTSSTAALGGGTAGTARWTIGANNASTSYAGGIRANSSLTKNGTGTLTLTSTTDLGYTGATDVNAGVLKIDGTKSGAGAVNVNNNGTLAGIGSVAGTTTIASGGHLAAGGTSSVGTLSLATLTLNAGSIIDAEFNNSPANDLINVTTGPLTINGGAVNLFNEGGTTAFATDGSYNLIQYAGGIGGTGLSALAVNNAQTGKTYSFGTDGTFVNLTISSAGGPIFWNQSTGGTWGAAGNWTAGGPPNSVGAFAGFGGGGTPLAAPATVTLDGDQTVGTLSFNSANAFTIAQGAGGSLILDNASTQASLTSGNGSHTISASGHPQRHRRGRQRRQRRRYGHRVRQRHRPRRDHQRWRGSLELSGNNTAYTGTASASAGKLVLGNANCAGRRHARRRRRRGRLQLQLHLQRRRPRLRHHHHRRRRHDLGRRRQRQHHVRRRIDRARRLDQGRRRHPDADRQQLEHRRRHDRSRHPQCPRAARPGPAAPPSTPAPRWRWTSTATSSAPSRSTTARPTTWPAPRRRSSRTTRWPLLPAPPPR